MWIDEVQAAVRRGLKRKEPWPSLDEVLPEAEYGLLLSRLIDERVEKVPSRPAGGRKSWQESVRQDLVDRWVTGSAGRTFTLVYFRQLLEQGLSATSVSAIRASLEEEIRRQMELSGPETKTAREQASKNLARRIRSDGGPYHDPLCYAHEVRLLRDGIATPLGRVFESLGGRRAVEWLLVAEMLQSTGPKDPWRISEETVRSLVDQPERVVSNWRWSQHELDEVDFPHSWEGVLRLSRLGLLELHPDDITDGYFVYATGLSILKEALTPDSPLRGMAGALLHDETLRVIRPDGSGFGEGEAVEWLVQAVAHGLRNALGPLPFLLDQLAESSRPEPDREVVQRVRTGLGRAFKLVEDLVDLHAASKAPTEPFDLVEALRDAVAAANGDGVSWAPTPAGQVVLRGHRHRLVHGLVDLIRNARHHPRPGTPLRLTLTVALDNAEVVVTFDDNGTGVPPNLRNKIFEAGFTTRPTGTGKGLTLLRDIVEREYSGTVEVGDSPEGGARFTLRFARRVGG